MAAPFGRDVSTTRDAFALSRGWKCLAGTVTSLPFSVGEDHDKFIRTPDGWRFVSSRWVELSTRSDALALA
jgi:hypothetical protein